MKAWNQLASKESVERTMKALAANGVETFRVASGAEAKAKVLSLVPQGAEVFAMSSITLQTIGLTREFDESGRYSSVRSKLTAMDQKTQGRDMRKLGAAPDFAVGSAHAVTETGSVLVASMTGSQLPAYASGAGTLIWVVGTHKIVKDLEEGMKRIAEYVVGLESARARKAYGLPDTFSSFPGKMLLFNKEIVPGRVKMILVDEVLGF